MRERETRTSENKYLESNSYLGSTSFGSRACPKNISSIMAYFRSGKVIQMMKRIIVATLLILTLNSTTSLSISSSQAELASNSMSSMQDRQLSESITGYRFIWDTQGIDKTRDIVSDVVGLHESDGRYNAFQNEDTGVVSYGKYQFTLMSEMNSLFNVLKLYTDNSQTQTSKHIKDDYLNRVAEKDQTLKDDNSFRLLLKDAASEYAMKKAQEDVFIRDYYEPAKNRAAADGVTSALGILFYTDTLVQAGLKGIDIIRSGLAFSALYVNPESISKSISYSKMNIEPISYSKMNIEPISDVNVRFPPIIKKTDAKEQEKLHSFGVNRQQYYSDIAAKKRKEATKLRDEGKIEEANSRETTASMLEFDISHGRVIYLMRLVDDDNLNLKRGDANNQIKIGDDKIDVIDSPPRKMEEAIFNDKMRSKFHPKISLSKISSTEPNAGDLITKSSSGHKLSTAKQTTKILKTPIKIQGTINRNNINPSSSGHKLSTAKQTTKILKTPIKIQGTINRNNINPSSSGHLINVNSAYRQPNQFTGVGAVKGVMNGAPNLQNQPNSWQMNPENLIRQTGSTAFTGVGAVKGVMNGAPNLQNQLYSFNQQRLIQDTQNQLYNLHQKLANQRQIQDAQNQRGVLGNVFRPIDAGPARDRSLEGFKR